MAIVLIVDDEDVLLEMLAALIEDLGHQPLTATNGQEALQLLRGGNAPALILSDVMMPRMSGVELVHTLKRDPHLHSIPTLLMSAAGKPREHTLADGFVHKPFDLDLLAGTIENYLTSK